MTHVAARAAGIDDGAPDRHRRAVLAHGARRPDDLLDPFALHAQRNEKPSDLRLRRLTLHDRAHHRLDTLLGQVAAGDELGNGGTDVHQKNSTRRNGEQCSPLLRVSV